MKISHKKTEFGELLKYTIPGYAVGLLLGFLLDYLGLQRHPAGQWLVRTFSGESESIFEGIYAARQRLERAPQSLSEAYGWGKFFGMVAPWLIDFLSRMSGVNVYGVEGFYIPFFYALSDQIGANVAGLLFFKKKEGLWSKAIYSYLRNPVMITSVIIILVVPFGLLIARYLGFSPSTQVFTSLETIAANLCWVPPLAGWLMEKKKKVESSK